MDLTNRRDVNALRLYRQFQVSGIPDIRLLDPSGNQIAVVDTSVEDAVQAMKQALGR